MLSRDLKQINKNIFFFADLTLIVLHLELHILTLIKECLQPSFSASQVGDFKSSMRGRMGDLREGGRGRGSEGKYWILGYNEGT